MEISERERPVIEILLDFEAIGVGEFTSLLKGFRSLLLRFFVEYLEAAHYDRTSFPYETEFHFNTPEELKETLWKAYCIYEQSYLGHYRKMRGFPPGRHQGFFGVADRPFENLFDEDVFDDWAESSLTADIEVHLPRQGSVLLPLSLAALMTLASVDYNYTILKDATLYVFERLKMAFHHSAPKNTIEHIPEIVRQLSRDKRVSKIRLRQNDRELDLHIEWHPRG